LWACSRLHRRWRSGGSIRRPFMPSRLAVIASVYIGFAVADGRVRIIVVECGVASAFVVVAAVGVTGSAWLLAFGLAAHGVKDAWQQRSRFVSGTRWWPPFCAAVDWAVALLIAIEIVTGIHFHP
jgi:hypothetical protein